MREEVKVRGAIHSKNILKIGGLVVVGELVKGQVKGAVKDFKDGIKEISDVANDKIQDRNGTEGFKKIGKSIVKLGGAVVVAGVAGTTSKYIGDTLTAEQRNEYAEVLVDVRTVQYEVKNK